VLILLCYVVVHLWSARTLSVQSFSEIRERMNRFVGEWVVKAAIAYPCQHDPVRRSLRRRNGSESPLRCWTVRVTGATSTGTNAGAPVGAALAASRSSFRHQYQNVHVGMWWRRAKLACDSLLRRHCATRRAIRAGVRMLGMTDPPVQRISEYQQLLKTGFVGRLPLVRNHPRSVFGCDFFVTITGTFRVVYVFVVMEVGTRGIRHWSTTEHPTGDGTAPQFRASIPGDQPLRHAIHDRDSIYSEARIGPSRLWV